MTEENLRLIINKTVWLILVSFFILIFGLLVFRTSFSNQLTGTFYIIVSGFLIFFVDLFLQTFKVQTKVWKFIYFILILTFVTLCGFLLFPAYFYFLSSNENIYMKILAGLELYIFFYYSYSIFKSIFVGIWEVDIV